MDAYKQERYADFLGELLIYVINRTNKSTDSAVDVNDIALLTEANFRCPICNKPLVDNTLNIPISRYEIIDIYRDDIQGTSVEKALIVKPLSMNDLSNKIALCRDHATQYKSLPTIEYYIKLLKTKNCLVQSYKQITEVDTIKLEDEIRDVVEELLRLEVSYSSEELSLIPQTIESKIASKDSLLINEVKHRVVLYYKYINDGHVRIMV